MNSTEILIWAKKSEKGKYCFNYQTMKTLNGDSQMSNIWFLPLCTGKERLKTADGEKAHNTQKPEALLYRVLMASSEAGDVVLDPFLGTGTTAAVAKKLGRNFIGIEKLSDYVKLAKKRIKLTPVLTDDRELISPVERRDLPRFSFAHVQICFTWSLA